MYLHLFAFTILNQTDFIITLILQPPLYLVPYYFELQARSNLYIDPYTQEMRTKA